MRSFNTTDNTTNPNSLVGYFIDSSQNSSPENIARAKQQINEAHRYLLQKYYFNETSHTVSTQSGVQEYSFPYNYSILKDITVTVGQLNWTPDIILTRMQWDKVNFLPYTSDIPQYFFIYDGKIAIFPIPSTTGNTITFNYKFRVPDLSLSDYVTGTVSLTHGSTTVTGAGTSWLANYLPSAGTVMDMNLWLRVARPKGDYNWYQVLSIESATSLTLVQAYNGLTTSAATYEIGQMPSLLEDFHDMCVFRPLKTYFSTIQQNTEKYAQFKQFYDDGIMSMDNYVGEKVINVNLGNTPQATNPNLFIYKQ